MPSKIAERLSNWNESANDRIADSWFGRYFRLDGSGEWAVAMANEAKRSGRPQEGTRWC